MFRRRRAPIAAPARPAEPDWWTEAQDRLVMVHDDNNATTRGLVVKVLADGVLLTSAELMPDDGPTIPLAGEVFIPREHIRFVQVPPTRKPRQRRPKVTADQGTLDL